MTAPNKRALMSILITIPLTIPIQLAQQTFLGNYLAW